MAWIELNNLSLGSAYKHHTDQLTNTRITISSISSPQPRSSCTASINSISSPRLHASSDSISNGAKFDRFPLHAASKLDRFPSLYLPSRIHVSNFKSSSLTSFYRCIGTVSRLWNRSDFEAVELKGAFGATTTAPRFIAIEAVSVHAFLPQFAEMELQIV